MPLSFRSDGVARRHGEWRLRYPHSGSDSSFPLARPSPEIDGRGSGCNTQSTLLGLGEDVLR